MIIKKEEISSKAFLKLIKSHKKWLLNNNFDLTGNELNKKKLDLRNKTINIEMDNLKNFNLSGSFFYNCDFNGHIILKNSDHNTKKTLWEKSVFEKCNFYNFSLYGSTKDTPLIMNNSKFHKCKFKFVKFLNCTLANVEFNNSKLFENVEFEDILTWDKGSKGFFTLSDIENLKQVTFSDSYMRGLTMKNITNSIGLSFEDVIIDEIKSFENIKIKSISFIDTKYLGSEKIPLFKDCILDDVSFKDSTELELFLEEEDGVTLHKKDDSILTISIKCHIQQKSFVLNFLSNLKKSINLKYNNLLLDIVDTSKNIKLIINSIDNNIKDNKSLILLQELTEHISIYFANTNNKFKNLHKSKLAVKNQNSIQSDYEFIGDCLFLDNFEQNKLSLKLSSRLDYNNEVLEKVVKELKEKKVVINNKSTIAFGGTISVENNQKSKILIQTTSDYDLNSNIDILDESNNIDIKQNSKVSLFRRITIGRKRNFLFLGIILLVVGLAFINYEKIVIVWNQISLTIFK